MNKDKVELTSLVTLTLGSVALTLGTPISAQCPFRMSAESS